MEMGDDFFARPGSVGADIFFTRSTSFGNATLARQRVAGEAALLVRAGLFECPRFCGVGSAVFPSGFLAI